MKLTYRQTTVHKLVAEGKSNKEIALALHIEVNTVKAHIHALSEKFGLTTSPGHKIRVALANLWSSKVDRFIRCPLCGHINGEK